MQHFQILKTKRTVTTKNSFDILTAVTREKKVKLCNVPKCKCGFYLFKTYSIHTGEETRTNQRQLFYQAQMIGSKQEMYNKIFKCVT